MIADVVALGARGPLGLSSLQLAMCVRARKLEPQSVKFLDKRGQEIGIALTGGLGERLYGFERLLGLAAPALAEAANTADPAYRPSEEQPLPVVLCLPEPGRADDEARFDMSFVERLATQSTVPIDPVRSALVRKGQAGFAYAIELARGLLDAGAQQVCVGGVDSYYHPGVLKDLDDACRLHAIGADNGFIPSEAAAFVMLARGATRTARLGRIVDAEVGIEASVNGEDEPNIAATTTRLIDAVKRRNAVDLRWAITDCNGERHRHREWAMASRRMLGAELLHTKWVWDTGDVGAASGPLFANLFLQLGALGAGYSPDALLALHSEAGERGVIVISGADHG